MTPTDLKALLERATKGPWRADEGCIIANSRYVLDDGGSIDDDADLIVALRNKGDALVALWEAADKAVESLGHHHSIAFGHVRNDDCLRCELLRALAALKAMP